VRHRTVDFDVREVEPGRWRWIIYTSDGTVRDPAVYRSRERAVEACHAEINDGIERARIQAVRRRS